MASRGINGVILAAAVLLGAHAAARADTAGDALLQKCVEAEGRLTSLQASFTLTQGTGAETRTLHGTMVLEKPNRALIVMRGSEPSDGRTLASDGKRFTTYYQADNEYQREAADASGGNIGRAATTEVATFFNADVLNQIRAQGSSIRSVGTRTIGGVPCRELRVAGGAPGASYAFFIGPDKLLHGATLVSGTAAGRMVSESRLIDLKPNRPVPHAAIAFVMPKGAKPYREHVADTRPSSGTDPAESGLLPAGSAAPNFELPQLDGGKLAFRSVYTANKATLLSFWNYAFAPCRDALPDLDKMRTELKSRGLEILTVNTQDNAAVVRKLWTDSKLSLPAVVGGGKVGDRYHVTALPTNYLIGRNGVVLAQFEGFDEIAIRAALAKAGVK